MRRAKPWLREFDSWWYATIDGVQTKLAFGKDQKTEAYKIFYEKMADRPAVAPKVRPSKSTRLNVRGIFNLFLADLEAKGKKPTGKKIKGKLELKWDPRKEKTFHWYSQYINPFVKEKVPAAMRLQDLKPHVVNEWLNSKETYVSTGTKNAAVRALKRPFNWAVEQEYIDYNPISGLVAPPKAKREVVISSEEHEQIIAHIKDQQFQDVVSFVWNTGCRPQELPIVEAKHVHLETDRIILELFNSKMQKIIRVIFLNATAREIIVRLMKKYPKGPLFRNRTGGAVNSNQISSRFKRLEKKIGKRFCLYNYRHTLTTDGIKKGVDPVSMAVLLGHSDPSTLAKIYQHVGADPEYMVKQAGKAR